MLAGVILFIWAGHFLHAWRRRLPARRRLKRMRSKGLC
jgi:hypothetical protein